MTDLHIVDVFAREKYTGNQLAVIESDGSLSADQMQTLAAEMDFSETTFVESRASPYRVRIFTPTDEVPFAGHPTLGTAHVIREHVADGRPPTITLDLNVGEIAVEFRKRDDETIPWMTQRPPEFGEILPRERLADVLSIDESAIDDEWPVQVVSTGLPTIVVPLEDREVLAGIDVDRAAYDAVTGDRDADLVLAFCPDPRDDANDLAVRVFAPGLGVPEDPATGSANGCLAGYLARHAYFGSGTIDADVEQGYEIGRPSLLNLQATDRGDDVRVEVGGSVVQVASGELC